MLLPHILPVPSLDGQRNIPDGAKCRFLCYHAVTLISVQRRTPAFSQPKRKLANATVSVLVLVRTRYLHTGVRTLSTRCINLCLQQLFTLNDTWGFCEDRDNFLMLSFISRVIDVCTQKTVKAVCWLSLVWLNQTNTKYNMHRLLYWTASMSPTPKDVIRRRNVIHIYADRTRIDTEIR